LLIGLGVILGVYWFTNLWRYEANSRRLRAAIEVAARDQANWQWGETFESGGFPPERDNVAKDITTWMLSRGFTEKVPRKPSPEWFLAFQGWERTNYAPNAASRFDAINLQIRARPNARLPTKISSDLDTIFGRKDADADLNQLRSWVDRPAGRYEYRPNGLNLLLLLPMVQRIRELANVLSWDASLAVEQGDPGRALQRLRTITLLSRSFGDDPFEICQLVRMGVGSVGLTGLNRVLGQAERLDGKQLARMQEEYLLEAEQPILLAMARGKRASLLFDFRALETDGELRKRLFDSGLLRARLPDTGYPWLNRLVHEVTPVALYFPSAAAWPLEQAAVLEYHNAFVEIAKRPEAEWLAGVERLPAMEELPQFTRDMILPQWFVAMNDRSLDTRFVRALLKYRAALRSAAATCAAERFRMESGRWPRGWEELTPRYLPTVPIDPFTQKPLVWKAIEDGVVIYSVGQDRTDEGGDILVRDGPAPKDVGFRLYSPTARRQPPIPFDTEGEK